jgi:hypothetical protein
MNIFSKPNVFRLAGPSYGYVQYENQVHVLKSRDVIVHSYERFLR